MEFLQKIKKVNFDPFRVVFPSLRAKIVLFVRKVSFQQSCKGSSLSLWIGKCNDKSGPPLPLHTSIIEWLTFPNTKLNTFLINMILLKSHWNMHSLLNSDINEIYTTVEWTQVVYNFSVYLQYIACLFPYIVGLFRLLILPYCNRPARLACWVIYIFSSINPSWFALIVWMPVQGR